MLTARRSLVLLVSALSIAAVATIGVERHEINALRQDDAHLALRVANDSAARDSTRDVSASLHRAMGDSLRTFQRLVLQRDQQRDAVDRALRLERRGRYELAVAVDSLHRTIASHAAVTNDTAVGRDVRRASFDLRQAPYTIAATVDMPPAPESAWIDLHVKLDPLPLTARLSCGPPNEHGIRAASIEATAPAWATVRFSQVEQSTDLCASPALAGSGRRSLLKFKPIVIGAGRIVEPDGRSRWGAFVGAGFAIGSS